MSGSVLTGVGAILCAAHADKITNAIHGHTWEIVAWFTGGNALVLQQRLKEAIAEIDHDLLPKELAWGEDIAAWIGERLSSSCCIAVDVSRPPERIYARWEA